MHNSNRLSRAATRARAQPVAARTSALLCRNRHQHQQHQHQQQQHLVGAGQARALPHATRHQRCHSPTPTTSCSAAHSSSADRGMDVAELSVTAAVREVSESGVSDEQLAGVLKAALAEEGPADGALIKQPWVHALVAATPGCRLVFSARSNPDPQFKQHLSTGLSPDHLFLSLLQSEMLSDMLVLYVPEQRVVTLLQLGLPVCGNPTLVHGGLLSAVFDETFGVVLYATGRFGHLELTQVFTARLEVDYKKPVPAEATIICDARIESVEGRKIWLQAELRDESGSVVYASSRALFVRPRDAQAIAQPPPPPAAAE